MLPPVLLLFTHAMVLYRLIVRWCQFVYDRVNVLMFYPQKQFAIVVLQLCMTHEEEDNFHRNLSQISPPLFRFSNPTFSIFPMSPGLLAYFDLFPCILRRVSRPPSGETMFVCLDVVMTWVGCCQRIAGCRAKVEPILVLHTITGLGYITHLKVAMNVFQHMFICKVIFRMWPLTAALLRQASTSSPYKNGSWKTYEQVRYWLLQAQVLIRYLDLCTDSPDKMICLKHCHFARRPSTQCI